ncbi:PREDICTED: non-functional pseudokinase ZED1 isoform X1 [Camelina sativa]|uniref:Non-functional pseudokinase ZED1 isoform X1 n=1 Tax=Camelina sativa TaxID=90675 RepID=A0ABM1RN12_CAMSA|nr:PREDICTED: non-functional pseudokinase ZED1 isoform X1 [Camelina sativa]XP_019100400.1 PREDICTED: non-functional pseudokinase ZED1 isoform X1 [Camelina sativa]XP_019100401.1 PREDICTED: non-functional pseudokinase ZED1 isoform X1 [Camelina sativa]
MSKNNKNKKKKISDLKNGGILLEELIASFDGKTNPIRCFSSDQILKATDNFSESQVISSWGYFIWYRGVIEERPVSIKKWSCQNLSNFTEVYRDISVSSQMSGHKNTLKLIGCCLEFDLPALVCEYAEHGPLSKDGGISSGEVLPWKVRLKIAKEIATSVTYLHTAFPETIIHRNINPTNIFIDEHWTAKLSDFWFCVAIPEGELYVEDEVKGVIGFVDPDYYWTMKVTEKVDIYSFGVVMLVLLSGRAAVFNGPGETPMSLNDHVSEVMERNGFDEIVDKDIWNGLGGGDDDLVLRRSQVEAFLRLALRCVRFKKEDPVSGMLEVAKELKLIEKLS